MTVGVTKVRPFSEGYRRETAAGSRKRLFFKSKKQRRLCLWFLIEWWTRVAMSWHGNGQNICCTPTVRRCNMFAMLYFAKVNDNVACINCQTSCLSSKLIFFTYFCAIPPNNSQDVGKEKFWLWVTCCACTLLAKCWNPVRISSTVYGILQPI